MYAQQTIPHVNVSNFGGECIKGVANGLSKKFGSCKILADFHGSCSLVFLAVVCVSESRFFDEAVSKSRFFDQCLFLALCLLLLIALVVHKRW